MGNSFDVVSCSKPSRIDFETSQCKDERFVVFPDISPAAKNHLLVIPKEHIVDVRALTRADIPMVRDMELLGIKVITENASDSSNIITGFHWPIHLVSHLHMHIISPHIEGIIKSIQFSRFFFGDTESAIAML